MGKTNLLILFACIFAAPVLGQSSVLVFPSGARTEAMGEVGTALGDDEEAGYYNPAGLGINNPLWKSGAASEYFEKVDPAFGYSDLWHDRLSLVYQPDADSIGGFSAFLNYFNMGSRSIYQGVAGLAWGFNFQEFGLENQFFGITAKFAFFENDPFISETVEGLQQDFALDAGYIWRILPFLQLGATIQNVGPAVDVDTESVLLPLTFNLAVAYKNSFSGPLWAQGDLSAEFRIDKQRDEGDADVHLGAEYTMDNTVSLRSGFLIDKYMLLYEYHYGLGLRVNNRFQFDVSDIYSPVHFMKGLFDGQGSNGSRNGQWGLSATVFFGD
jgi:hypothetical protein